MRHAYAGEADPDEYPDDDKRPLTKKGARKFLPAARGLGHTVPKPDKVLASGTARTWQTARLLSEQADWPDPEKSDVLDDGSDPEDTGKMLGDLWDQGVRHIALVGHGPQLSSVIAYMLTGESDGGDVKLKKGGAALLDYSKPGESELKWVMPRKALAQLDNG